uniref:Transposase domain-containing protein n=2 Tax=Cacopsylla melanoneura TaxID=428564 RepID=A0A8D9DP52_9HEMI
MSSNQRKSFFDLSASGQKKRLKAAQDVPLPGSGSQSSSSRREEDVPDSPVPLSQPHPSSEDQALGHCPRSDELELCPSASSSDEYEIEDENNVEDSSEESSNDDDHDDDIGIREKLRNWASQYKITATALTALLHILTSHICFSSLPLDGRTLCRTPRNINTVEVEPGHYSHIGLKSTLIKLMSGVSHTINTVILHISTDGLPLFKSMPGELWPILGSIKNVCSLSKIVFPIGIYFGKKKPIDCCLFLKEFVEESIDVINNGITIEGRKFQVLIQGIICDTPARSYILGTKSHTGYSSCIRCKQEGIYDKGRMTFPSVNAPPRCHEFPSI